MCISYKTLFSFRYFIFIQFFFIIPAPPSMPSVSLEGQNSVLLITPPYSDGTMLYDQHGVNREQFNGIAGGFFVLFV